MDRHQLKLAAYRAQRGQCYDCGGWLPPETLILRQDEQGWFLLCPPCAADDLAEAMFERAYYG